MNRLFDRAMHPNKPGAVLLELGGPEEGIVIPAVSRWLDADGPKKLGMREGARELFMNAFLRLGLPPL